MIKKKKGTGLEIVLYVLLVLIGIFSTLAVQDFNKYLVLKDKISKEAEGNYFGVKLTDEQWLILSYGDKVGSNDTRILSFKESILPREEEKTVKVSNSSLEMIKNHYSSVYEVSGCINENEGVLYFDVTEDFEAYKNEDGIMMNRRFVQKCKSGTWHSHPYGSYCVPSRSDWNSWITQGKEYDGLLCDGQFKLFSVDSGTVKIILS